MSGLADKVLYNDGSKDITMKEYINTLDSKKEEELTNLVAKMRKNIGNILNGDISNQDIPILDELSKKYNEKLTELTNDLGKEDQLDLTNNDTIKNLRKNNITYKKKKEKQADSKDINTLETSMEKSVKILKYLEVDEKGNNTKTNFNTIDTTQNELTTSTTTTTYTGLYNTSKTKDVDTKIDDILKDTTKTNILKEKTSFLTKEENQIAMRIGMLIGVIKKYLVNQSSKKISSSLCKELQKHINNAIKISQKLKAIHNIRKQLKTIEKTKNTLNQLNSSIDLGELDITSTTQTKDVKFQDGFCEGKILFDTYTLNPTQWKVTDANGKQLGKILIEDKEDEIKVDTSTTTTTTEVKELSLEKGGKKIKIGKVTIENDKIQIEWNDNDTIKGESDFSTFKNSIGPRNFTFPLTGSKKRGKTKTSGSLSHTKDLTGTVKFKNDTLTGTPPYTPTKGDVLHLDAALIDDTELLQKKAEMKAQQESEQRYAETSKGGIIKKISKKLRYNLTDGKKQQKSIKKSIKDAGTIDNIFNEDSATVADRMMYEADTTTINTTKTDELNSMCEDFMTDTRGGILPQQEFKTKFKKWIEDNKIAENLDTNRMGTNLYHQLQKKKDHIELINQISTVLTGTTTNKETEIQNKINNYETKHTDTLPELSQKFTEYSKKTLSEEDFTNYINAEKANLDLSTKNLDISLRVVKAKSAQDIDDPHKKGRAYNIGNFLNKHPLAKRFTNRVGIGQGFTTYAKYANQRGAYEDKLINNYQYISKKMNTMEQELAKWSWKDKIHHWIDYNTAKNQIRKYKMTTQGMENATTITKNIHTNLQTYLQDTNNTTNGDKLLSAISEGYVRIKCHHETGHNFLYSETQGNIEKETTQLRKTIMYALKHVFGSDTFTEKEIKETLLGDKYKSLHDKLIEEYNEAAEKYHKKLTCRSLIWGGISAITRRGGIGYGASLVNSANDITDTIPTPSSHPPLPNETPEALEPGNVALPENTITDQPNPVGRPPEGVETDWDDMESNFNMGSHELLEGNNNMYNDTKTFIENFNNNQLDGSKLEIKIGAGTDGSTYISGHEPSINAFNNKIQSVKDYIDTTNLSNQQKQAFKDYLDTIQSTDTRNFQSDTLKGMREAEGVEQMVKGLDQAGIGTKNITIEISHDDDLDVAGVNHNDPNARMVQANMKLVKEIDDGGNGGGGGGGENGGGGGNEGGNTNNNDNTDDNNDTPTNIENTMKQVLGQTTIVAGPGVFKNTIIKDPNNLNYKP